MSVVLQNRSLSFASERGKTEKYYGGERIRIVVEGALAPVFNNANSYLKFNVNIDNTKLGAYCIPDPKCGANGIFESIQIRTKNGNVLIEQLDNLPLWEGIRTKYGRNVQDEHLGKLFEGYGNDVNLRYQDVSTIAPKAGGTRPNQVFGNRLGGFQSQYYNHSIPAGNPAVAAPLIATTSSRPAQILYRFNCSGLLRALKDTLTNPIVMGGLIIEFILSRSPVILKVQQVSASESHHSNQPQENNNLVANSYRGAVNYGYGRDAIAGGQFVDANAPSMSENSLKPSRSCLVGAADGDGDFPFAADLSATGIIGTFANQAALVYTDLATTAINNNATIAGLAFGKSADAASMAGRSAVDAIEDCPFTVGSEVLVGRTKGGGVDGGAGLNEGGNLYKLVDAAGVPVKVAQIGLFSKTGGGDQAVCIKFDRDARVAATGGGGNTEVFQNNNNAPLPPCCVALDNITENSVRSHYIDEVELVLDVCDTQPEYIRSMVSQAQSGRTNISIDSWRDVRVNINANSVQNEIFIPTNLNRAYSILVVPENLSLTQTPLNSNILPPVDDLKEYCWNMDGQLVPNQMIKLDRLSVGGYNALAMIELEKCLDQTSIQLRDMRNPAEYFTIGKRITADGMPISLNGKTIKLRLNYKSQPNQVLVHFFIHYNLGIVFEGGQPAIVE